MGPWLVPVANLVRDLFLLGLCGLSFYFAPTHLRKKWGWRWHPLREIAVLFVGIFVTAHPVIELLSQGGDGPFGPLLSWLVNPLTGALEPGRLFWMTGLFSAFLDNAPAYLIFFTMAGGDAQVLSTTMNAVLVAISAGAVFMGALTYIGNAPNLLVKAIAEEEYKVAMPSFFGYMAWSLIFVVPLLLIVGLLL